jgi:hypothetical protein
LLRKRKDIIDSSDKEIVTEAEGLDVKAMIPLVLKNKFFSVRQVEVLFNEKLENKLRNTGAMSKDFVTATKKLSSTFFMVWNVWWQCIKISSAPRFHTSWRRCVIQPF